MFEPTLAITCTLRMPWCAIPIGTSLVTVSEPVLIYFVSIMLTSEQIHSHGKNAASPQHMPTAEEDTGKRKQLPDALGDSVARSTEALRTRHLPRLNIADTRRIPRGRIHNWRPSRRYPARCFRLLRRCVKIRAEVFRVYFAVLIDSERSRTVVTRSELPHGAGANPVGGRVRSRLMPKVGRNNASGFSTIGTSRSRGTAL